jgi:putative membrane protein
MAGFFLRALITAVGLWLAAKVVPGFSITSGWSLVWAAVLLGVVNAIVRPVLFFLTLPVTILTLGLFLLVLNAAMIGLVAWLLDGVVVTGFFPALLAWLVVSLTSWVASWFIGAKDKA